MLDVVEVVVLSVCVVVVLGVCVVVLVVCVVVVDVVVDDGKRSPVPFRHGACVGNLSHSTSSGHEYPINRRRGSHPRLTSWHMYRQGGMTSVIRGLNLLCKMFSYAPEIHKIKSVQESGIVIYYVFKQNVHEKIFNV